ncbi:MAG: prepilin-type N-terminal cleavage/methylation domain-containing protein [Candidatus Omnitrophota bacterium]
MKKNNHKNRSFTLIELIMSVVIIAIVMIPVAFMSMEYIYAIQHSRQIAAAEGLAKVEMAKVNNLAYTDSTLADGYDNTTANYEGYPFNLRRTVSYVSGWSNNLKQVQVRVYPSLDATHFLVNLITYVANVTYGAGSGGTIPSGGMADSLVVTGGSISGTALQNVTLQNTSTNTITISEVIVTFTGEAGIKVQSVIMNTITRWTGNANSPRTAILSPTFTLSASTTYTNTGFFNFSKNLSTVSVVFVMSDGSQTAAYSW